MIYSRSLFIRESKHWTHPNKTTVLKGFFNAHPFFIPCHCNNWWSDLLQCMVRHDGVICRAVNNWSVMSQWTNQYHMDRVVQIVTDYIFSVFRYTQTLQLMQNNDRYLIHSSIYLHDIFIWNKSVSKTYIPFKLVSYRTLCPILCTIRY